MGAASLLAGLGVCIYASGKSAAIAKQQQKSYKAAVSLQEASQSDYEAADAEVKKAVEKEYLLIDGYNIVFAWEDLREMALQDIMP